MHCSCDSLRNFKVIGYNLHEVIFSVLVKSDGHSAEGLQERTFMELRDKLQIEIGQMEASSKLQFALI